MAADPKHLGAQIGFLSILHTWGQTLQRHPHIHCVVPGGGLSPDGTRWISSRSHFFLPVRVLSRVFRGKFIAGLRRSFQRNKLVFHGACLPLAQEKAFAAFLRTLFRQEWIVYAKPPFGGPEHVLQYLARYTHRVAISNHRLLSVDDNQVRFRWKDYAHHNKRRTITLSHEEFLRRFLQHVLPRGFPRIRYFGWLANRKRGSLLPVCRDRLACQPPAPPTIADGEAIVWQCPRCHGPMRIIERLTASRSVLKKVFRSALLIAHSSGSLWHIQHAAPPAQPKCVHALPKRFCLRLQSDFSLQLVLFRPGFPLASLKISIHSERFSSP